MLFFVENYRLGTERDDGLTVYKVPSPTGELVAVKMYGQEPASSFRVDVRDAVSGRVIANMPVVTGAVPDGRTGSDATVLNWVSPSRLEILTLSSARMSGVPAIAGGVTIDGGIYDRVEFMSGSVSEANEPRITGTYGAFMSSEGKFNQCELMFQAPYPTSHSTVGFAIGAFGPDNKSNLDGVGGFNITFFVSSETDSIWPELTLTQAKIHHVFVGKEDLRYLFGPMQNSTGYGKQESYLAYLDPTKKFRMVSYIELSRDEVIRIFEKIRDNQVFTTYGFGNSRQTTFLRFDAQIDQNSISQFSNCEMQTRVSETPLSMYLDPVKASEVP